MSRGNLIALAIFVGLLVWVFKFDNQATRQVRSVATSWFSVFEKSGDAVDDKLADGAPRSPPAGAPSAGCCAPCG